MYTGIDTVYLIHHSHTDIGYTHDQPIVWDLHRRFIDTALDQCERDADGDRDDSFRWTIESTAMLMHWVNSAPAHRVDRFIELARGGRIEVTGMAINLTPLFDSDQVVDTLTPIRFVREELGLPVRYAMNSDVNGENWPLVDTLLDAGISGFSMATNIHFGGSPLAWPNAFRWQGPSGRSILAWNGWDYGFAHEIGIGQDVEQFRDVWWPKIDQWLNGRDYALPGLMLQIYDAFGDNGPACTKLSDFVRNWNETVDGPRLRIAVPSDWWKLVEEHQDKLDTHRGDWTDYWNFGCGSSAREVAINRASRTRLRAADAAIAAVDALGGESDPSRQSTADTRGRAWHALNLWDEHTWGADISIWQPYDEDTIAQWHHKANYAYTARSLSTMLARDAVAELARSVQRDSEDAVLMFNPLPFERTVAGRLPVALDGQVRGRSDDPTAARHSLDRSSVQRSEDGGHWLREPVQVPGYGYTVVSRSEISQLSCEVSREEVASTGHHRIVFDLENGGISSWFSQALGRELVDKTAGWPLGGWIHESPVINENDEDHIANPRRAMWKIGERRLSLNRGWQTGWKADRRGPSRVIEHVVEKRDDGVLVRQHLELPNGQELWQQTFLPAYAEWIECSAHWMMGLTTDPEATYIAFPVAVPEAAARFDVGGQAVEVHTDQLPRACRDYYTVQNWVDFSNQEFGVTIACPDAPLVQLGDFNFGANMDTVELTRSMMLGWVTNNYWETNFRAHQPGMVGARYRLLPHGSAFDEREAHQFGQDSASPLLMHHLHEPVREGALLPNSGSLLHLPSSPVLTQRIWAENGSVYLRLLNASEDTVSAVVSPGVLKIEEAFQCDLLRANEMPLQLEADGSVVVLIEPRMMATLRLRLVQR